MTVPLLTFVHMSDTHLPADRETTPDGVRNAYETVTEVIQDINALEFPAEFVLHTGDVGHDPSDESSYGQVRQLLSQLTAPLHVIPGNHDHNQWLYNAFGQDASNLYYTFERKGVKFICLCSNVPNSLLGAIGPEQLSWLEAQLSGPEGKPVVVALHHHPFLLGSEPMDTYALSDGEALHSILKSARAKISCVLFGHIHETLVLVRDGITYASVQSAWYQLKSWPGLARFYRDPVQTCGFNVVSIMPDGMALVRAFRVPSES